MTSVNTINLFVLPFAGGSFYAYNGLREFLPAFINMVPLDLPGHGMRLNEPLLTDIHAMADDIFYRIEPQLDTPYAIFGHSMGAVLGYLLGRTLGNNGRKPPLHLFLSGRNGPRSTTEDLHTLPRQQFFQKVADYGGMPGEIMQEPELVDLFEPILRADFQAVETYRPATAEPIAVPVTLLLGEADKTTRRFELQWRCAAPREITVKSFSGGHFFIFNHLAAIGELISQTLWNTVGK